MRPDRRRALSLLALGAGGAPAGLTTAQTRPPEVVFLHGVASGDPRADGVVLWTRVSPAGSDAQAVDVRWEVAEEAGFKRCVAKGVFRTGPERDLTVKVEAAGLRPGRDHFYRFKVGAAVSPVGRTRTLSRGRLDALKLGVVSCSLHPAGLFNAYDHIAKGPPLDAVIHLGDYIYEYGAGVGDYGMTAATAAQRRPEPPYEIISLGDYRARHAQYKRDPDLQAAHAAAPWIVVWDDHEVCNDTWLEGAQNHQTVTEGPFDRRKAAALQAYYEWMPIREPAPGRGREAVERAFDFGDLATLVMVETRLSARSQQVTYADPTLPKAVYDASDPGRRTRVSDPAVIARVTGEVGYGRPAPAPYVMGPDVPAITARLSEPSRELLGAAQQTWLAGELKRSMAEGRTWQVLGNQVVMGRAKTPNAYAAIGGAEQVKALTAGMSPAAGARLMRIAETGLYGAPYNLDGWDGYPAARERLLQMLRTGGGNTVVLAGDSHAFWVNELRDDATGSRVAAEFGTSGITSPSVGDSLPQVDIAAMMMAQNPEIRFCDQKSKGYVRLTLTRDLCRGELIAVGIAAKPYEAKTVATWTVRPTAGPGVGEIVRV